MLLNQRLAILPSGMGPWLRFINVGAAVENKGRVDPGRFLDPHLTPPDPPLHPTAAAQADIARMIEPLVSMMMGDNLHH